MSTVQRCERDCDNRFCHIVCITLTMHILTSFAFVFLNANHITQGRVYCTCGYFPMINRRTSEKESIRQQQEVLTKRYEMLNRENEEDKNIFSLKKIQRSKQLFDVRLDAQKLNERMHNARVREPGNDILRLSRDGKVGLTREGGVCCKVPKGLAVEYHILGRFGVASLDTKNRDNESEEA